MSGSMRSYMVAVSLYEAGVQNARPAQGAQGGATGGQNPPAVTGQTTAANPSNPAPEPATGGWKANSLPLLQQAIDKVKSSGGNLRTTQALQQIANEFKSLGGTWSAG
jgi:hypothetical protein